METVASSLFQTFHELALPYLYTSVIVNDLPLFLDPAPNSGLGGKITPKKGRLRMVKHLRIAALGPPHFPRWSVAILLETGNWHHVDETETQRTMRIVEEGTQELEGLIDCLEAQSRVISMPQIETMVVGQRGACGWEHISKFAIANGSSLLKDMDLAASLFALFVRLCQPDYICLHTFHDPYFFHSFIPFDRPGVVAFTSHQHDGFGFFNFIGGAQNRYIIEPGSQRAYDGTLHGHALVHGRTQVPGLLLDCLAADFRDPGKLGLLKASDRQVSTTVYGLFDPLVREDFEANPRYGSLIRAQRQAEERRARDHYMDFHSNDHPQFWRARLNFEPIEQSPCCLACGWKVQDGWHD